MTDQNSVRKLMVAGQVMPNKVNDESIVNALSAVPRENFLPKSLRGVAYVDQRIQVSDDRYVMDPMVLAKLLLAADTCKRDLALVVGAASGYEAAVLGQCVDAVVALEEDEEMVERATADLLKSGADNVAVVKGDLISGAKGQGPFDLIFINGAVEEMPQSLLDQLADGGRIACIMIDEGVAHGHIIEKFGKELVSDNLFEAEATVLSSFKKEQGFVFP